MNFARNELMKYGWKEGDGLGKTSNGIVQPVRQKLKFDTKGVGYQYGEEFSFKWWEYVYDKAAATVNINSAHIPVDTKSKTDSSTKKSKRKKISNKLSDSFIKGALLENNREVKLTLDGEDEEIEHSNNEDTFSFPKLKMKLSGKQARLKLQEDLYLQKNCNITS